MEIIGSYGDSVLFSSGDNAVLVNKKTNNVVSVGKADQLSSHVTLGQQPENLSPVLSELAEAALIELNIEVFSAGDRMYTIPKGVVAEAKRGLEWRKEHDRGGTKVGMNTARTLAKGGQIGIRKIRHIAKYFPRHEVDKKGKGYKPGEDGYPSAGRIAWALWGGDAAKRWASAIVEREDKKLSETSMLAAGFYSQKPEKVYLENFADEFSKFAIRIRKDNAKIDRLYQVDPMGQVFVWDDGCWDDLGNIHNDFETYDKSLDGPYDTCEKVHVPVDANSATVLAGLIDSKPLHSFSPADINSSEYDMLFSAKDNIDWQTLALVAATDRDGNYTSEERSEKAKKQYRDRQGRFGKEGTRVKISSDPNARGLMESIDEDTGKAKVKLDSGETIEVDVAETEVETPADRLPKPPATPVDLSGVLGEAKTNKQKFKARLPVEADVLNPEELAGVLADYPEYVQKKREERRKKEIEEKALRASAEDAKEGEDFKDPSESDIQPIYMAIVADDDPQAVMDLIALVPANENSTVPITFKRADGKWEADEGLLADLNSPTPPPVVVLEGDTFEDVLKQVDSSVTASAGSPLRAEKYWLSGPGSQKISWGTPGDWTRCVAHTSKYLGQFAPAYASILKKKATGVWVGDPSESQEYGLTASGRLISSDNVVKPEDKIIESSLTAAKIADARQRVLTAGGKIHAEDGSKFYIPLVIPEGVESGDSRIFEKGAITIRELPLPLLWQIKTGEGHNGSVVVGRIDRMERTDDGIGNAYGVFDDGNYGREAERLVKGGFIRGVSADLDKFEADEEMIENASEEEEGSEKQGRIKITKARVMAVTLVPKPAFQECTIKIEEDDQEEDVIPDGVYAEDVDPTEASSLVACGITAGVIPTTPPSSWFDDPKLKKATPLTVDDEGRVFGHIAAWHVDHIGMSFGTKPPRSRSKYAYFHTGLVRTEEGSDVPVGQLTLAGGHAALEMNAQEAVRHYDDTASAIADVHAGEDAYGIWVAGALRPGTSPEQIRALRASAPSGDWRPIKGHLELVAVCQVNVPGFPVARSRVASGQVMALVAAGANTLAHMKSDPMAELKARIDNLERRPLEAAADDARSRILAAKAEELASRVKKTKKEISKKDIKKLRRSFDPDTDPEDAQANAATISKETRERLAKEGKAMPDGAYPIRNVSDLKNAIQAFGRAKESERTEVRKHIVKRARGLGREELIPENWPEAPEKYKDEASLDDVPEQGLAAEDDQNPCWEGYEMIGMKEVDGKKVPNCVPVDSDTDDEASIEEFKYFSPEKRKKLAEEGKALPDGSFPIENSRDLKNAIWAFGRSKPSKREEVKEHIERRAKALDKEDMLPDIWKGEGSVFSDEDDDELIFSIKERLAIVKSVVAAGGLDRNRGNAERLRRYWTKGPGAVKIRWGTPGDWKRCVRYLSKYMGPRAKGYCQLRHKEATGVYTGSKLNPGRSNSVQELGLSEALSDTFEMTETFVSDDDMRTPIEWILEEADELFDDRWEPDEEIVSLCRMVADTWEDGDDDYDSVFDSDEELYEYDEVDSVFASKDPDIPEDLTPEEIEALKDEAKREEEEEKNGSSPKKMRVVRREGKYTAETQPRDAQGRFRKVLARLKLDLGTAGLDKVIDKVEEIENLDFSGDYSRAAEASKDLIGIIDRLDKGGLNPESLENVRASSEQLGKVIANLPFAFGQQEEKIRFSDVPPALRDLIEDMIERVEKKIGQEDADIATADLKSFMSGNDYYSQADISSQMSKLLRLLT